MKKFLSFLTAILFAASMMAADPVEIVSGTFNGKGGTYTEGWSTTGTGISRNDCVIVGSGENITSPSVDLSQYESISIAIKARRYGTLSGSKATIAVTFDGEAIGSTEASGTSATTSLTAIEYTVDEGLSTGTFVFTCSNATSAGSTHGAGINSIVITGVKKASQGGETPSTIKTIYCKNAQSWWFADGATVGIYAFKGETVKNAAWPGVRMTAVEGETNLWKADIDTAKYEKIIFVRVSGTGNIADYGAQTEDLTVPADKDLYTITSTTAQWSGQGNKVTGTWSVYKAQGGEVTPVTPAEKDSIYFVNVAGWAAPRVHLWDGTAAGTEWPGVAMTKLADKINNYDVYKYVADKGAYAKCIFSDNGENQTADLDWTSGKYFYNDGWYAKDAIPGPVVPAKFYITGDSALVVDAGADKAKAWSADAIKSEKDTFTLSLKANQNYILKVVADGNWLGYDKLTEKAEGLQDLDGDNHNIGFKLAEAGDVKVVYFVKDEQVTFKLIGNFFVPETVMQIAGAWNVDEDNNNAWVLNTMTNSTDKKTATYTVELKKGEYEFKVIKDGTWLTKANNGEAYGLHREWTGVAGVTDNATENLKLTADTEGEYTFVWTFANDSLGVLFPEKIIVPVKAENYIVHWDAEAENVIGNVNLYGGIVAATTKINTNTTNIDAINLNTSYNYTDGKYVVIKPARGKFLAGDTIEFATLINNATADGTKYGAVYFYAADGATNIYKGKNGINGRTSNDVPLVEQFILEADQDSILLGRYGNTATYVSMLNVARLGGEAALPCEDGPYAILVNGKDVENTVAGEEFDGYKQYVAYLSLTKGDSIQLINTSCGATWLPAIEEGGMSAHFKKGVNAATIDTTGCFDLYIKMKEGDDKLYIGAGICAGDTVRYYIAGEGEGLDWTDKIAAKQDTTVLNLKAGDYKLKVVAGENWKGFEALTDTAAGLKDLDGDDHNIGFTLNEDAAVTVVYNDSVFRLIGNFYIAPIKYYLAGTMTNWKADSIELVALEDKADSLGVTIALKADSLYEYKVVRIQGKDTAWYGIQMNEGEEWAPMTYGNSNGWWIKAGNDYANVGLQTTKEADYTFVLQPAEDHLVVSVIIPEPDKRYYAKAKWAADAEDWAWIELEKNEAGLFLTDTVVYYGGGMNINSAADDALALYYSEAADAERPFAAYKGFAALDTVIFAFNPADSVLTVTLVGKYVEPAPVLPVMQIAGAWNVKNDEWVRNDMTVAADELTATYTVELAKGYYDFKLIKNNDWISKANGGSAYGLHREWTGVAGVTDIDSDNLQLHADVAGTYTFTWTFANDSIGVVFPALPVKYCEFPTGHFKQADFGDANARILLTIQKIADSNNLRVAVKNNKANGNTKTGLNYLWVNATGAKNNNATYGSHDAEDVEEVSVIVEFDEAQESYVFNNIHWAYAGWGGEWAIDGLTVLASELCEAPETPAKFYITGDSALVVNAGLNKEKAWAPDAIKVTEDSYTFENLAAGDYKLKVTDGAWSSEETPRMNLGFSDLTQEDKAGLTADKDNNICFILKEAGNVVVTCKKVENVTTFTVTGNFYVPAEPEKVLPKVGLGANFNGWNWEANLFTPAKDSLTASIKVNLGVTDTIQFKIVSDGNWLSLNGEGETLYRLHRDWNKAEHVNLINDGRNFSLVADAAGDYTFTWTYADSTLVVTFPEKGEPTLADGYYLVGKFSGVNAWTVVDLTEDKLFVSTGIETGEYSLDVTLAADDEFKVVRVEDDAIKTWFPEGDNNNYKVDANHAGAKTIYFRPEYNGNDDWHERCIYVAPNSDTPTGINAINADAKAVKVLRNGILVIEKNGKAYNAMGQTIR